MNNTALAIIQPQELDTIQRTAKLLAASGYFGTTGDATTSIAQVAAKILAGRELGFGPFASVNGVHIISGKPAVGANLMAAAVRANPRYDYRVKELSDTVCELEFFDNGKVAGVSRFTIEDAKNAELSTGRNAGTWKKYPRNMLFARAMSNGVRWYAPDIFSGNVVYVPEELGVEVDGEGNVVDTTHTVSPQNAPERTFEASTVDSAYVAQIAPQNAVIAATEEANPFDDTQEPTAEELALIAQWSSRSDAENWAIMVGACANDFEAKNSLNKSVNKFGGKVTKGNLTAIYTDFIRHQYEKLQQQPVAEAA